MNRKKFIKQSGLSLLSAGLTPYLSMANLQNNLFSSYKTNKPKPQYDVIIIGGSFAGLSAALTLARCLRTVLVVDAGKNRNRFSKQANNALALDGKTPKSIISNSIDRLNKYEKYLDLLQDSVIDIERKNNEFTITT
ncbi:MAG: FAD-dependent oxidoreductase, partial [Chitinophagaceae bacterium]